MVHQLASHPGAEQHLPDGPTSLEANAWIAHRDVPLQTQPFGITLIGPCGSDWQLAELGQRLHHSAGLKQRNTGVNVPVAQSIHALAAIEKEALTSISVVGAHLLV